jgi:hypothetical protein
MSKEKVSGVAEPHRNTSVIAVTLDGSRSSTVSMVQAVHLVLGLKGSFPGEPSDRLNRERLEPFEPT